MSNETGGDDPPANVHPLYMQTLGDIIRIARQQKRISQERLGEILGVTRSAVNQWENNHTVPDSPQRLRQIAEALDIDPAILVRAGSEKARPPRGSQKVSPSASPLGHALPALIVWKSLPARGSRFGGFVILAEKDGEVPRPDFLQYNQKAFAFKVITDANMPVYRPRDRLLVDPETPAIPGDDCLFGDGIELTDGSSCVVGHLIRSTATLWIVHQYNTRGEIELPKGEFPNAWPIVGRYMRS